MGNGRVAGDHGERGRGGRLSDRFSSLSRRDVLKAGVFAGAAIALPAQRLVSARSALVGRMAQSQLPVPFTIPFAIPPVAVPYRTDATTDYYKIWMSRVEAEIIPGYRTPLYAYNGTVPGPTIKATQGRQVKVRHFNTLPAVHETLGYEQWTSVHLHGSASLPQYDGYASDVSRPGQYKDYLYPNFQPARTIWYHDHGVHHTAENVYHGLAAQYHLTDPAEQALPLPKGEFDVPLILSDAMFNSDGSLLFSLEDESGMYGDVILVNGRPWPAMKVKRRKYRFRVLNGCVSRSFRWSLDTGDPVTVIATDGGLMPRPQSVQNIRHGMAERYDVVIDFSKYRAGRRVVLRNASPKNNENFLNTNKIMAFDVVGDAFDRSNNSVPSTLSAVNPVMDLQVGQAVRSRTFDFKREHGQWTVNGRTWDDVVNSGFEYVEASVNAGDVELWTLRNGSGGWFHPAHIHLIDFKIVDRNGRAPFAYERGPKDVVYLGENETVRLLAKFDGLGKYMMHCHNLVHEDHDMMTQFEVVAPDAVGDDPFSSPAQDLPELDDL
jgi:FtsP/CotA-like multicopper oxidase with cupredoxin domain